MDAALKIRKLLARKASIRQEIVDAKKDKGLSASEREELLCDLRADFAKVRIALDDAERELEDERREERAMDEEMEQSEEEELKDCWMQFQIAVEGSVLSQANKSTIALLGLQSTNMVQAAENYKAVVVLLDSIFEHGAPVDLETALGDLRNNLEHVNGGEF